MEFARPVQGYTFLVVVDAYLKWLEVQPIKQASSRGVIDILRSLFATFGVQRIVFSNNGTAFVSEEIRAFYMANGIKTRTSAPYNPTTNGQVEVCVACEQSGCMPCRMARFLFRQDTSCHNTTGKTPAELMFGRNLPCHLDAIAPQEHKVHPSKFLSSTAGRGSNGGSQFPSQASMNSWHGAKGTGPAFLAHKVPTCNSVPSSR